MIRTFIQITSLMLTLEAALFLAEGNLGLSAENFAMLVATRIGYNPELLESLVQQSADTWVGVVLVLVAFLLQMWNAVWPLRWDDFQVHETGVVLAFLFCIVLCIPAFCLSEYVATTNVEKVRAILKTLSLRG
jgi:energy-coupling factor transporter transmembrane protein EcfT